MTPPFWIKPFALWQPNLNMYLLYDRYHPKIPRPTPVKTLDGVISLANKILEWWKINYLNWEIIHSSSPLTLPYGNNPPSGIVNVYFKN